MLMNPHSAVASSAGPSPPRHAVTITAAMNNWLTCGLIQTQMSHVSPVATATVATARPYRKVQLLSAPSALPSSAAPPPTARLRNAHNGGKRGSVVVGVSTQSSGRGNGTCRFSCLIPNAGRALPATASHE
jgi:hypothetical protein